MGHVKTAQNSLFNGAEPVTISMVTALTQSETFMHLRWMQDLTICRMMVLPFIPLVIDDTHLSP